MKTDIFDFPVERVPLFAEHNGEKFKAEKDAVLRTDTNDLIGYISAQQVLKKTAKGGTVSVDRDYYKIVTHAEVVNQARQAIGELGLEAKETTFLLQNGGRMIHQFDFTNLEIEPMPDDFLTMRLSLFNSYDLSYRVGFEVGGMRKVCTNGMIAFRKAFFELRRHSGGFDLEGTMKNVKKALDTFQMHMLGFYKLMGATPLDVAVGTALLKQFVADKVVPEKYGAAMEAVWENPEMANSIIPATDVLGKVIPNQFQHVMQNPKMDEARTVWSFYNAVTLVLTHYVASMERRALMHQQMQKKIAALVGQGA